MSGEIKKLDQETIDKIAAGEVIIRPSNALKELIENSIDADSTQISISFTKGGLRSLTITDNGNGILPSSLSILCSRFTTSKNAPLSSLTTFGFRGEALACLSHLAYLKVTSKAEGHSGKCAEYKEGVMVGDMEEVEWRKGTKVEVMDLFMKGVRREGMKEREEAMGVVGVAARYAVMYELIGFKVEEEGEMRLETKGGEGRGEVIRRWFGGYWGKCFLEERLKSKLWGFEMEFIGVPPNECKPMKKSEFIMFVNGRLVENKEMKKALEGVYHSWMERKFKYLAFMHLQFPTENLDVNVHPTKKEVNFLHEDEVIYEIEYYLKKQFSNYMKDKKMPTQTENKENIIKKNKEFIKSSQAKLSDMFLLPSRPNKIGLVGNVENTKWKNITILQPQKKSEKQKLKRRKKIKRRRMQKGIFIINTTFE
jgi:DNA mismatch repair protein MLH1